LISGRQFDSALSNIRSRQSVISAALESRLYVKGFAVSQAILFTCDPLQAARALANLAAHGDSNGNNAAVGREAGALEALVHLTCSNHEGVRYV
jgi:hypothetical protein